MRRWTATLAVTLCLMGASAPALADGAGPDDCTGKSLGAACYNYDTHEYGTCAADVFGVLTCEVGGSGGTGMGTGTGTQTTTTTTSHGASTTTASGAGGEGPESESSSGCAATRARSKGGAEAIGIGLLFAACVVLQRRRR